MAIKIDDAARAAITRRRARGRTTMLCLRVETIPMRSVTRILAVDWAPRRPHRRLVTRRVGGVALYVGERVARYTQWHDLTISAWRLGPFERLVVVDEPLALLALEDWERSHPSLCRATVA